MRAPHGPGLVKDGGGAPRALRLSSALFLLLACLAPVVVAETTSPDLAPMLDRLGRVAWLYADTALRFSCRETITVDRGSPHRYDYIYAHDESGRFKDYRTRPGDRGGHEVDLADEHLRRWVSQAYSLIFFFRADRRERFHFTAADGGTVLGRPALRIEFVPTAPYEEDVNDWSGAAYIDRETWQILKVEGWPRTEFLARARYEDALEEQRTGPPPYVPPGGVDPEPRYYNFETVVTEFGAEKNGMRFPSEVRIEMRRYRVPGRNGHASDSTPVYQVRQAYTDYRFFSVRTAAEIKDLLAAPAPPGSAPPP